MRYLLTTFFLFIYPSCRLQAAVDLPKNKPALGERNVLCASIKYIDKESAPSASGAQSMCNQIRSFYVRNSRGLLDPKVKGVQVKVPFPDNRQWDNIKRYVKSKYPNYDQYALIVGTKLSASHAGGGVAWLRGLLYRDAQHEYGHLTGLGHAGRYEREKGKLVLKPYNDGESVMGRFPSDTLTGPQYRWVGWLPKSEVAVYNEMMLGQPYEIKRITDTKLEMLSLVGIPQEYFNGKIPPADAPPTEGPHRDAYLSFSTKCDACLSLHLSMGGGSQKVAMFGKEYWDSNFTGMYIKILESSKAKIKFTIEFKEKPAVVATEVYPHMENESPVNENVPALLQE
jgi:hypothetical protein